MAPRASKFPTLGVGLQMPQSESHPPAAIERHGPSGILPLGTITNTRLFQLSYDLRPDNENYEPLWHWLETLGALRIQQSIWWVPFAGTAVQLRDHALSRMDGNDSVNVIEMSGEIAGYEARTDIRIWIERYLKAFSR